ncbi:hypothetical protein VNI00_013418 [Paramarasmius palmivorus]|uniref:Terpene synthase n=1 Tax=Paramarasmius palmivorus TaxID=297713 RepID=A0AAW0BZ68_9AGAR
MSAAFDTSFFPESFTTFPTRLHKNEHRIAARCDAVVEKFRRLAPTKNPLSYGAGPHGVFYAFLFPEGETEKTLLCAELIESAWLYDDVIEALPHEEAALTHATVKQMFMVGLQEASSDPGSRPHKPSITDIFQDIASRMMALDPKGTPWVLGTQVQYWGEHDSSKDSFYHIEDYVRYRILNIGFRIMVSAMQWCLDIYLSDEETTLSEAFYTSAARVVVLTNDYWSRNKEKDEVTDRVRNAIPVVMHQYSMNEADASIFVKGMIVDAEQKTRALGLQLDKQSDTLNSFVHGIFLMLGGGAFWSSTCPRYNNV